MIPFVVLVVLMVPVAADKTSCSDADVSLVDYIKWQMNTNPRNKPENCKCTERHHIAFNARLKKNLSNLSSYAVVIFDHMTLNEGSGYQPKTGLFTCPENGVYFFSWTILTEPKSRFHSELVVDGKIFSYNYNMNTKIEEHKSASQTVTVKLKKGSKVWIRTHGGNGISATRTWSTFSGFRI